MQTKLIPALLAPAMLLALAAPALAGNGNTLYLVQESPPGTTDGNNFLSDQTLSDYSTIDSRQQGEGNQATVTIKNAACAAAPAHSHCGQVTMLQSNSDLIGSVADLLDLSQLANTALITVDGNGSAALKQVGGGNDATLTVHNGIGLVTQLGVDNTASLKVENAGTGSILQTGSSNVASLDVIAVGGGHASLSQVGVGLSKSIEVTTTTPVDIWMFGFGP